MKNKSKSFLLTIAFCFFSLALFAQSQKITGVVVDNNQEPLPGVIISVKDSQNATMTDPQGKYSIDVPKDAVLVFSMIGFETQEKLTAGKKTINVTFSEIKDIRLGDVVVIGYGNVKKEDLTGAVSKVGEKEFAKGAIASPDRLLIGKVAGVQITPDGGAPGSSSKIRIRGGASLNASNEPLIVIDGVPGGNLSALNPNDIESMNVLKDASATAIYGSRASNGVIIITTKRAKYAQKLEVAFNTKGTISHLAKKLDVLSANQMRGVVANNPLSTGTFKSLVGSHSTDWQDQIFQTAFGTDNNLSIAGATRFLPFRVSVGYAHDDGILKTGYRDRLTTSINLNPTFLDSHLRFDISLKGGYIKSRNANVSAIASAITFDPTQPVYDSKYTDFDGYFTWMLPGTDDLNTLAAINPMLLLNTEKSTSKALSYSTAMKVDYVLHCLPELKATLNVAQNYVQNKGHRYVPAWSPQELGKQGVNNSTKEVHRNQLFEFYVNYTKDLTALKSHIDVVGGYTYQDWKTDRYNYIEYNALGGEYFVPEFPMDYPRNTLISFFGRINYSLMDKYLLTASIRRDGSSRFSSDDRWGMFPAVALAWKMKNENFLKDVKAISELKLRMGFGTTGQQDLGNNNYLYLARYSVSQNVAQYQFGNNFYHMYSPAAYDRNIKWESTSTYNVALDFGFLNDKLTGSVDFYVKNTKDLLSLIETSAGANFSNQIWTNIGKIQNKGVELSLNLQAVETKDFSWDINFNASYNTSKIKKLTNSDNLNPVGISAGWISGYPNNTVQVQTVGYTPYTFYLYKQVYDEAGKPIEGVYNDGDDNGTINSNDLVRMKSPNPDFMFGFGTTFTYKKWSLETMLRSSIGNYVYNNVNSSLAAYTNIFNANNYIGNTPIDILKSNFVTRQPYSDYYLENASFLKMDYLMLGYNFGQIGVFKNLRASLGLQNVFTITKYSGYDPEVFGGIDRDFYPRPRIYSLSLNMNF